MNFWETIRATVNPRPLSQAKANQLNAEAKEFFDKLLTTGKLSTPDNIPLVLGADEVALLHEPSKLIEARATRVYGGVGARVKGIYIGSGKSRSVQGMEQIDSGMLTLTTKRLVFTGSMESRAASIKDIVSVDLLPDGIEVTTGKKAKRQIYLVHNPVIWTMLVRYVAEGKLSANVIKPVDFSAAGDIRFNCPQCGQHLTVERKGAGMAVSCPGCNAQIEIPRSSDERP
ncbi:MAG TPA: hypothetical protein VGM66_08905 [Candidatus Udaeobacter sp.]|jgi:hypothetical protein